MTKYLGDDKGEQMKIVKTVLEWMLFIVLLPIIILAIVFFDREEEGL